MTRHAELVRAVLVACNMLPGVYLMPYEATVARRGRVKQALGWAGVSDVIGWMEQCGRCAARPPLKNCKDDSYIVPRWVAFEVKVGRDTLSPAQRAFLDKVTAAGGIALEIRDVMTAVEALT